MDTSRLDRIEKKIDDGALQLARIEERLIASTKRIDRHEHRLDEQESELDTIKTKVLGNSHLVQKYERLFWILITGAVSFFVWYIR